MTMTPSNNTQEYYRTADLALTAALCVAGFVVVDVDSVSPQRSVFIFQNSLELEKTVDQYWRGESRVDPQAYFQHLKIIKARIYQR